MKKPVLAFLTVILTALLAHGQEQFSRVVAEFHGDSSSLATEVQAKIIHFTLKNQDANSRAEFENNALMYSKLFTVYIPPVRESPAAQAYVLTLHNNTQFKMLNRLFVSSNIDQVEFNGAKISREDFFKPYMK